jgi:hypothetical protein
MNTRSNSSQSAVSTAIRVPGELRLKRLFWVLILFLTVDGLAYGIAAKMFRRYQAVTATASDKRLDALGERLDAVERQLRSLTGEVSNAATTAAAAAKQSQAAVDGIRQLEQQGRNSRRQTK